MARFALALLSFVFALFALTVRAAPLQTRQIGNLQCNLARLSIVKNLAQTGNRLNQVDTTDPAVADAVTTAQGGLQDASDGIKTIAGALLTGQTAPAAARDQVASGLQTANDALVGLNSADPAVADTLDKLSAATDAGNKVVATCK
ncbi:hypothetical protein Moror_2052 [Moniliophthora roreri MCA 2997]|uniref:Hydrophobic surface binding protein n=1 Tax=Moniliophthora roreri (strain MCA 2997) TaxID=1381753 RepID=V2X104_MONRO|nr:hypothetical protein Moror_2052 [Moniliophthora roreri MCA 2997]